MSPLPYTPVVRAGPWLLVSGQVGLRGGALVPGGVRAEAEQALTNLAALLAGNGAAMGDVVKTTVFLKDMAEFGSMNEVYAKYFDTNPPARATVEVARLPRDARVEIEAIAFVK